MATKKATKKATKRAARPGGAGNTEKLRAIIQAERRVSKYETVLKQAKEKALSAKHDFDGEVEELRALIADSPQGTLYGGGQK